jgi:hypothetical protein
MTAVTSDLDTSRRSGGLRGLPVAAATILYVGILACIDALGRAVQGADTAGLKFAGVVDRAADNSSGAAEDIDVEVWRQGVFQFAVEGGCTQADIGKDVYVKDNATVGFLEDVTNRVRVGKLVGIEDASYGWVAIDADGLQTSGSYTIEVVGPNATDFDLSSAAAKYGGSDFYVQEVLHAEGFVTATHASDGRKIAATHWTLAGGTLTAVGDETANTWLITFIGRLA